MNLRFPIFLFGLGFCQLVASPATAQEVSIEVAGATRTVEVEVSSAVTVAFGSAFAELSMADPEIADLSSLSDKLVYVLGKSVGQTTMTVIGPAQPEQVTHVKIVSYRDVAPMQGFLAEAAKGVTLARDGVTVTVSGCAARAREQGAVESVVTQLKDWGYVTLTDVGAC